MGVIPAVDCLSIEISIFFIGVFTIYVLLSGILQKISHNNNEVFYKKGVFDMQNTSPEQVGKAFERLTECLKAKGYDIVSPCVFQMPLLQPEKIKFALDVQGIKYYNLKDKDKILLDAKDYQKCMQIAKENRSIGCFMQEYAKGELEQLLKTTTNIKDACMFTISNIPLPVADILEQKLGNIKKGLLIERSDNPNGTFDISVSEKMLTAKERQQFINAYMESVVVTYGVNAPYKDPDYKLQFSDGYTVDNYNKSVAEHRLIEELSAHAKEVTERVPIFNSDMDHMNKYFDNYCQTFCSTLEAFSSGIAEEYPDRINIPSVSNAYKAVIELQSSPYEYAVDALKHQIELNAIKDVPEVVYEQKRNNDIERE